MSRAGPTTRSMTALNTVSRSTRLSQPHTAHEHHTAPQQTKRTKRVSKISKDLHQFKHARPHCTGTHDAGKANSIPSHNLSARESQLILKENQFKLKSRKLEQQLASLSQKETEAAALLQECKNHLSTTTQTQLDDYFTCPLCFEIMACPYSLNPRQCGHSFCATCILKWFFSRLHRVCASWHEPVDCPICRSALFSTPDNVPRPDSSFPFTPNRTADNAIRGMINSLADAGLADWAEDGHARQEWCRKERVGRHEMTSLATSWTNMNGDEFVSIKSRLEV
ncbi:hypothetical protein P692DRAFT_20825006 [Suillus brevipes Sb2]|nr:hypothetical protein P692DRAFT_20825006 [Suillus brevipes Sb2]